MKIWIDGFEANVPQRLGSSQVAFELLKNIESLDKKNNYTVILANPPLDDLPKEREGWKYKVLKIKKFKTYIALPLALFTTRDKPDLFFSPTHYTPVISPVPRVMMIFDLSYLRFPQYFKPRDLYQMKLWTKISVMQAEHIITISKSSYDDILKYYGVSKDKVTIAYPGYNSSTFHPLKDKARVDQVRDKYQIHGKYAVFLGTVQPKKNLIRLIEAFKNIEHFKLVVVGKTRGLGRQAWMFEEILNKPKELGIEEKIVFTGFVPDEDLPALISGAEVFLLPSLWEGFGIPALESMACGTPVIVSNVSSLPEVVGEAGVLIDPLNVEQLEQAIRSVAFDKKLRLKKSKEGLEQAKKFSWDKMARQVLKVFEKVDGK